MTGLELVHKLAEQDRENHAQMIRAVTRARDEGASWAKIAEAIGVTRWAARCRYHDIIEAGS